MFQGVSKGFRSVSRDSKRFFGDVSVLPWDIREILGGFRDVLRGLKGVLGRLRGCQ